MPNTPTTPTTERTRDPFSAAFERTPACPPSTVLVEFARGVLSESDAHSIQLHASGCASCAAEIEASVELLAAESTTDDDRITHLVERLTAAPQWHAAPSRPEDTATKTETPAPLLGREDASPAAALRRHALPLALAAGLLLAVALSLPRMLPPELPEPISSVLRNATLDLSFPIGSLSQRPTELRWEPTGGVALYRAEVRNVSGTILHTCTIRGSSQEAKILTCDLSAATSLVPGARYSWRVSAFNEGSESPTDNVQSPAIATSRWIDFSFASPPSE